jgi:hypothetical protein
MSQSATVSPDVQPLLFQGVFDKDVQVTFDAPDQSSDGGALLLAAIDRKLRLCERLAAVFHDPRQPGKVDHSLLEIVRQRVLGLAAGYEDGNDAGRLSREPLLGFLCGKDGDEALASSSTLCRAENSVQRGDLLRMGHELTDAVILHQRRQRRGRKVPRITIDLDPADDPTHGDQQLTFFNAHYDTYCYLPLLGFVTFHDEHGSEEAEQFLAAAVLRPGNVTATKGARGLLRQLMHRLRGAFPGAILRVRLDGGFAAPEIFAFLEAQRVEYLVNMASNAALERMAEPFLRVARERAARTGVAAQVSTRLWYRAQTWPHERSVICKAEVVVGADGELRDNPRFVVSNLSEHPRCVYRKRYCRRGEVENRIKELMNGVALGRTSCTAFLANQLRVHFSAAAYVLFQALRSACAGTELARAQVDRLRDALVKVSAYVRQVTRRLYVALPEHYPWESVWRTASACIGAWP